VCNNEITQFHLPPTHEPYLPLLPSLKASPRHRPLASLASTHCAYPRRDGQAELTRSHTEINVSHRELNPDTVTRWMSSTIATGVISTANMHGSITAYNRYYFDVVGRFHVSSDNLFFWSKCLWWDDDDDDGEIQYYAGLRRDINSTIWFARSGAWARKVESKSTNPTNWRAQGGA